MPTERFRSVGIGTPSADGHVGVRAAVANLRRFDSRGRRPFLPSHKCDSLSNYISYLAGEEGFEIKSALINNLSHGTYYDETPSSDELKDACDETIRIVEKYAKGQLEVARALQGAG